MNEYGNRITGTNRINIIPDMETFTLHMVIDSFHLCEPAKHFTSISSSLSIFNYHRIHLKGYTGTAGKINSISQPGNDFSTKDADNDKCICKCSQMATGGRNCSILWSSYFYWHLNAMLFIWSIST